MSMISHLDHLVLTTANLTACLHFYGHVLGMKVEKFLGGTPSVERIALKFGQQKINVHEKGREFEPKAQYPQPGSLDLCFIAACPLDNFIQHLAANDVPIEEGPVNRTGANGQISSVYVRDPDKNLIEISEYLKKDGIEGK